MFFLRSCILPIQVMCICRYINITTCYRLRFTHKIVLCSAVLHTVIIRKIDKMAAAMLKHTEGNNKVVLPENRENEVPAQSVSADKGKRPAGKAQYKQKTSTITASGSKDPPPRPASAPPTPVEASTSNPTSFNKEALEILREMNKNINKTNDKVEALSVRVDSISSEMENSENYDYESYYDYGDDNGDEEQSQLPIEVDPIEEESENIFQQFSVTFKKSDVTSDPVDAHLASVVNEAFREGMADEMHQDMIKKIHRPSNCESLKETKVNPGVWSVLRQHTQSEDSKLRGIQNCMIKAACNIVKVINKQANKFDQETLQLSMNAIGLLGQGNKWLNARRKEYHKRDMDPKLHHLCSSSTSFTDMLYGDSIVKDIKDIQEMNKISRNVGSRYGNKRVFRGGARFIRGKRGAPYQTRRGAGRYPQSYSQYIYNSQNKQSKNGQKGAETKK